MEPQSGERPIREEEARYWAIQLANQTRTLMQCGLQHNLPTPPTMRRPSRSAPLMVQHQHEATQIRAEMSGGSVRQGRDEDLPIGRDPALASGDRLLQLDHQFLELRWG